ncbi:hypothetical protein SAMN05192539_102029 [Paraburkholderia diazotrophica]|uniref:Uncharacterized protein n=1 Tax=Paraburkholderia diazotrophica TaxID=667676 RepID=A0A1H7C3L3_9BURK|nr:hypothetical protein SAMN05192539_102029 [Paraburkholderia diazotrophica]
MQRHVSLPSFLRDEDFECGDEYGADYGYFSYMFKNLCVSDTPEGAIGWAAEWLRGWIDDNV